MYCLKHKCMAYCTPSLRRYVSEFPTEFIALLRLKFGSTRRFFFKISIELSVFPLNLSIFNSTCMLGLQTRLAVEYADFEVHLRWLNIPIGIPQTPSSKELNEN